MDSRTRDSPPRGYDGISTHTISYRKAIETRAQPWTEQLNRYRAAHPDLSVEQVAVLDRALILLPRAPESDRNLTAELLGLDRAGLEALGSAETTAGLATVGPSMTGAPGSGRTVLLC